MKKITDQNRVQELLRQGRIDRYLNTENKKFVILQYDAGEIVTSPDIPFRYLHFLMEGSVQVYHLLDNGDKISMGYFDKPRILGDIEFCFHRQSVYYAEAITPATCLALPIEPYREQLDQDIAFLHVMLNSIGEKLFHHSPTREALSLEERVRYYFEKLCDDHELHGVEKAAMQLRCSRRQLQRVLKALCEKGVIEHIGKGRYRLKD